MGNRGVWAGVRGGRPQAERGAIVKKGLTVFFVAATLVPAVLWMVACRQHPRLSSLRVIYAGDPGTAETESFRKLLAEHVKSVTVIPVLDLAKADLSHTDVLVVGGQTMEKVEGKIHMQRGPKGITLNMLPIPTVLIGGMGARIADDLDLKLGWRHG
jgi:hypothetical protein